MAKIIDKFIFQAKSNFPAGMGKEKGFFPFYTSSITQNKFIDDFLFDGDAIILGAGGSRPSIHFENSKFATSSDCFVLQSSEYSVKFLYYYLLGNIEVLERGFQGAGIKHISKDYIGKIEIPDFTFEDQIKIVKSLDQIQTLIEKRLKTIELLDEIIKSSFHSRFGDPVDNRNNYDKVKLLSLGNWQSGGTPPRNTPSYFTGKIPWFTSGELNDVYISNSKEKITKEAIVTTSAKKVSKGSLLLGMYDTAALKSSISTIDGSCNQAVGFALLDDSLCNVLYVYYAIQLSKKYHLHQRLGARQQNLNISAVKNLEIPLPSIELQNDFAVLVNSILKRKLVHESSLEILRTLNRSFVQLVFAQNGVEKDSEIVEYLSDINLQKELFEKIRVQNFQVKEEYDKAKKILFELLETGESLITQTINERKGKIEIKIS